MSNPDEAASPNGAAAEPATPAARPATPEPPAPPPAPREDPGPERPFGAGDAGPERPFGAGDSDTEQAPSAEVPTESTATGAMVTGIVGILMDVVLPIGGIALGVISLMLASAAKKKIAASNGTLGGENLIKIARVLGFVAIVGAFIAAAAYATFYDDAKN